MASQFQIEANRRNAQLSTGPNADALDAQTAPLSLPPLTF